MKNYITILEDKGSGKFTINNPDSLGLENDVYDEIKLINDNENTFLMLNRCGKCGLFDVVEKTWIYKPEYDCIRFIDIQETPQSNFGKSYMCELQINGVSGLFLFTKDGNKIVSKKWQAQKLWFKIQCCQTAFQNVGRVELIYSWSLT